MAQATISARIDEKDKQAFDNFCSDVGLHHGKLLYTIARE